MKTAVITGASSGLGLAISHEMRNLKTNGLHDWKIINWSREHYVHQPQPSVMVNDWWSVKKAADAIEEKVDVLINCAGINIINKLEDVDEAEFDEIIETNVKSIFLCTQHLLEKLRGGTVLNIVSNAAHVPMTHSLAYNASKAAAWMMTRQLARELMPSHNITVFSVSPNKLRGTGMSKDIESQVCYIRGWTPEQAAEYQKQALLTKEETEVGDIAEFIAWILSEKRRHKWFAGCDIPYGL